MKLMKKYIIEEELELSKYTDIKNDTLILNFITSYVNQNLYKLIKSKLDIKVSDYFRNKFKINISKFIFNLNQIDYNKSTDYLLYALDMSYSIFINNISTEGVNFIAGIDYKKRNISNMCINKNTIKVYSYDSNKVGYLNEHEPDILKQIHSDILDMHNEIILELINSSREELICIYYNIPDIKYIGIDRNFKVYDLRKCKLKDDQ